jgi:tripartite-type tricarboxylate transporter receptor subunit TctC
MTLRTIRHLARLVLVGAAFAAASGAAWAQAANFPQKPVRIVVPFAAGGASDIMTRQIAEHLRELWNQPVLSDPKPGASGIVAAEIVAKSEPDGYTALLHVSGIVLLPLLNSKLPLDPMKELAPVSQVSTMALAFGTSPSIPAKTLDEFVALAKANPGKYNVGSFGSGSAGHLYMEILKDAAKIDITHIPYKGELPALTDLLGGQISSVIVSAPGFAPYATSGKLVPLAVTGQTRSPQLPNTPTFVEAGFREPGLESTSWYGMFLPAGTPAAIVEKFSRDLRTVLAKPELKRRMQDYGIVMTGTTPQELAEMMRTDSARWAKVIREKNIQAN